MTVFGFKRHARDADHIADVATAIHAESRTCAADSTFHRGFMSLEDKSTHATLTVAGNVRPSSSAPAASFRSGDHGCVIAALREPSDDATAMVGDDMRPGRGCVKTVVFSFGGSSAAALRAFTCLFQRPCILNRCCPRSRLRTPDTDVAAQRTNFTTRRFEVAVAVAIAAGNNHGITC